MDGQEAQRLTCIDPTLCGSLLCKAKKWGGAGRKLGGPAQEESGNPVAGTGSSHPLGNHFALYTQRQRLPVPCSRRGPGLPAGTRTRTTVSNLSLAKASPHSVQPLGNGPSRGLSWLGFSSPTCHLRETGSGQGGTLPISNQIFRA